MFHLIGFIFRIIIAIRIIGLSLIASFVRGLFGWGRRQPGTRSNQSRHSYYGTGRSTSDSEGVTAEEGELHPKRKKIFDKDEGEYVDFEEVKE